MKLTRREILKIMLGAPVLGAGLKLLGNGDEIMADRIGDILADALPQLSDNDRRALQMTLNNMQRVADQVGGHVAQFDRIDAKGGRFDVLPHDGWRVLASSATTVAGAGAEQLLSFDSPNFDTADNFDKFGFFDLSAPTRITIPRGVRGYYIIGASIRFSFMPDQTLYTAFTRINGTAYDAIQGMTGGSTPAWTHLLTTMYLNAGDYIEWYATQNSGSDETCTPTVFGFRWR
ncbi:MAG: hypothetical protein FVQ79_02175 [Planctomycetes bacterium]|nr:hypothetical protein [Planctomycetota bacterium]